MRRYAIRVVLIACISAASAHGAEYEPGPIPQGGQTFYASFDEGPRADEGAGFPEMHYAGDYWARKGWEFMFGEGRMGKALNLRPDQMTAERSRRARGKENACFKFQGHVCLRVGTVSFWMRAGQGEILVEITFDGLPTAGALEVSVGGEAKEITEVNNVARIPGR